MAEEKPSAGSIGDFLRTVSEAARAGKTPPEADKLDQEALPYGIAAGDNKAHLTVCATCGKPPTQTGMSNFPEAFLFRDTLSAREYRISGLCQDCQDRVFKEQVEEEE